MGKLTLLTESVPATPGAGYAVQYPDSLTKRLALVDDAGKVTGIISKRDSTAAQGPGFASDTYLTDSGILIPSGGMRVGQRYQWKIGVTKTAAGTASAVYTVRIGSAQTTADTSRLAMTASAAQTAAADEGLLMVDYVVRSVAASGVCAGCAAWAKTLAGNAGLGGSEVAVGAGFDNQALAGLFVGLSINGGASAAWTVDIVSADLIA